MLCGRGAEVAILLECMDHGASAAVVGEAGIGKTALLRATVEKAGLPVFEGGGLASLSWLSYLPVARALGVRPPMGDHVAVAAFCVEHVGDGVLILDDLHWTDADTASLVPLLAGRIRLLCALRSGDPATRHRREQTQAAGMRMIELGSLADADAAALVRARRPNLAEEQVAAVVHSAAGNPFLLEELSDSPGGSESLRLSFAARLERLSGSGRNAVARMALLARPAEAALIGPGADEARQSGLADAQVDGRLTLRHALIGEAAVVGLGESARADLHAALARAIDDPGECARHYAAAGERDAAYASALAAAGASSHEAERARHLALAATCAPDQEAVELRLASGMALLRAGHPREALELADAVHGVDPVASARAAEIRARAHVDLEQPTAAEHEADSGLALVSGTHAGLEGRLLLVKARCRSLAWDAAESLRHAQRAVAVVRAAGEPQAQALMILGLAYWTDAKRACLGHLADAVSAARREGDQTTELESAFLLAAALLDFGEPREAERATQSLLRRSASLSRRQSELRARYLLAWIELFVHGRPANAVAMARDLMPERAALGAPAGHLQMVLGLALAGSGQDRGALDVIQHALEHESSLASRAGLLCALGQAHWLAHRPRDAAQAAQRCLELDTPYRLEARLVTEWARRDGAGTEIRAPAPGADEFISTEAAIAELIAHEEATPAAFDRAAIIWQRCWRANALRCRLAAAEAALFDGDTADARRRLLELEAEVANLGWAPLLGRVQRSLRRVGVSRSAPRRHADGLLTAREREVLELVAEGLTSTQIAGRLGITPATVDSQVKSAMRKLGARTRRQAATVAAAD